jgi:molybdate transport system substrate-binding protein
MGLFAGAARADLTVFAAASTTDAMKELGARYEKAAGEKVRFNFASSGALANQIVAGAPADVYLSASTKWMVYLDEKSLIEKATSCDLLANQLVLVEPLKGSTPCECDAFTRIKTYKRLAVGDFKSVPAGAYAEQALTYGKVLDGLAGKLVKGDSVRRVLFYVELGEVSGGIVYATDAKVSAKVTIAAVFPPESHKPIRYPVAVCTGARQFEKAADFVAFLKSPEATAVFAKYGFSVPGE